MIPTLAISLGDPNGIGPEVVLAALADRRMRERVRPLLVGSLAVLEQHAEKLGWKEAQFQAVGSAGEAVPDGALAVLDVTDGEPGEVAWGETTEAGGRLSMLAVERGVRLCLAGEADALVTAPISKEAIQKAGYAVPGHTEFLAELCGVRDVAMLLVAAGGPAAGDPVGALRVALLTSHVPLRRVPGLVTVESILAKRRVLEGTLRRDFGIDRPRVAVLGLNPHAGDGGVLGNEEADVILPAVVRACAEGLLTFGPFPADGYFATGDAARYDAVLAMYHDQGLAPFKALAFDRGVNFTAGLPIVRTSPDHGTAFGIAGQGRADAGSMRAALWLAADVARRRKA